MARIAMSHGRRDWLLRLKEAREGAIRQRQAAEWVEVSGRWPGKLAGVKV